MAATLTPRTAVKDTAAGAATSDPPVAPAPVPSSELALVAEEETSKEELPLAPSPVPGLMAPLTTSE